MAKGGLFRRDAKEVKEEVEEVVEDFRDMVSRRVGNDSSNSPDLFSSCVKDLSKASAPKQIAVGAGAGWLTGYLTMKVGKMAATTIGGSLLLLQIAHHKGYIKVDWNKMTSDSATLADKVKDKLRVRSRSGFEKFQAFAAKNAYLAGGFTGGFFLGIASS